MDESVVEGTVAVVAGGSRRIGRAIADAYCDILVNKPGMSPLTPTLASITEEYDDEVSAVNLKSPSRLGVRFGSHMADHFGGVIISISTIGSIRPSGHEIVDACAKSGLNALAMALADSDAPKVRCNAILPGAILTDIADARSDEARANAAKSPMGRAGYASDFPGAALFRGGDRQLGV